MKQYCLLSHSTDLLEQKIHHLQQHARLNFAVHIGLLSILSCIFYWHTDTPDVLFLWSALTLLMIGGLFHHNYAYQQKDDEPKFLHTWLNINLFLTSLVSLCWGISSLLFLPELAIQQALLIIALSTVLIASITLLTISRCVFYLQSILLFIPLLGQLILIDSTDYKLLSLLLLMMALMLIIMVNAIYRVLYESQRIQYTAQIQAHTDPLTQLANRRDFDKQLKIEWQRAICHTFPLTLLMIDVDYFKQYNDQKGHLAGDNCLKQIATMMTKVAQRQGDHIARYGGDEFSILLPNTPIRDAVHLAEKLRKAVAKQCLQQPVVTLSIGVANCVPSKASHGEQHSIHPPYIKPEVLISTADQALYQAKAQGRNCVVEQCC